MIRLVLNELSMNQNEESVKVQLKNYGYLRIRMVGLCWKLPKMLIWQIFQGKAGKELGIWHDDSRLNENSAL